VPQRGVLQGGRRQHGQRLERDDGIADGAVEQCGQDFLRQIVEAMRE
jgi:hypothetical protein